MIDPGKINVHVREGRMVMKLPSGGRLFGAPATDPFSQGEDVHGDDEGARAEEQGGQD